MLLPGWNGERQVWFGLMFTIMCDLCVNVKLFTHTCPTTCFCVVFMLLPSDKTPTVHDHGNECTNKLLWFTQKKPNFLCQPRSQYHPKKHWVECQYLSTSLFVPCYWGSFVWPLWPFRLCLPDSYKKVSGQLTLSGDWAALTFSLCIITSLRAFLSESDLYCFLPTSYF